MGIRFGRSDSDVCKTLRLKLLFKTTNNPIKAADWSQKRVWLIGASTGIGAALGLELAKLGAQLILSARKPDTLLEVANQCLQWVEKSKVMNLPFDLCNHNALDEAIDTVHKQWGGVDLVIFNAGTYEATRVPDLSLDRIERSLGVNLIAPMNATKLILPLMLNQPNEQPGRGFAYVASVAGYRGLPQALTYGPGKAGIISFAESLWVDLQSLGLNTWIINPGFVRTRLTDKNEFKMPALIEPEEAAQAIIHGFSKGHFEIHFPKRFTYFMKLLRILPLSWYLRLVKGLVPPLPKINK